MKKQRWIYIFSLFFSLLLQPVESQILTTSSNYHTVGYKIALPVGYDPDKTASVNIRYKAFGANSWLDGFPPERVTQAGEDAFIGSLFYLQPGSDYQLEATLLDSFPTFTSQTLPVQNLTTRSEPNIVAGSNVKWVSPTGSSALYTEASSGNLSTLLSSGAVTCGTTIYLKGGTYFMGEMSLNLSADCTENTPINIMAAPGETPIIDGGYTDPIVWTQDAADPKLYSASLPPETAFSTLCLLDTMRLYPYPAVEQINWNGITHPYYLRALNLGDNGFVRDANTIFIKTAAGINPNTKTVTLSKYNYGLVIYGNGKQNHLNFKGITFKNFGKAKVLDFGATIYSDRTLDLRNINHLTIDSCRFEWNNTGINLTGNTSYVTVQNCRFKDQTGFWSHAQVKKANDVYFFPLIGLVLPTTFGRFVENAAISMAGTSTTNYVVRNNFIDGFCNGTSASFENVQPNVEADFYGNIILNSYDGIECDGKWSNLRVWNNEVGNTLAGISLAPPQVGPTYVFRNVFHHIISRRNTQDDPYYIGCQPVSQYFGWGVGIKTNSGATGDAALYFINNTFHTSDSLGFAMYSWDSEWIKFHSVNNIFSSENNHLLFITNAKDNTDFQFYSERDNYYCPNGMLLEIKALHGQFDCYSTNDATEMQTLVQDITGSDLAVFEQPFQHDPQFIDPSIGNFSLDANSLLLDAGKAVAGFYDFLGVAPDIGAKESAVVSTSNPVQTEASLRIFPNPTTGIFEIQSDGPVQSVSVVDSFGKMVWITNSAGKIDLTRFIDGIYFVRVNASGRVILMKIVKIGR
jgi:hypothetical protein